MTTLRMKYAARPLVQFPRVSFAFDGCSLLAGGLPIWKQRDQRSDAQNRSANPDPHHERIVVNGEIAADAVGRTLEHKIHVGLQRGEDRDFRGALADRARRIFAIPET